MRAFGPKNEQERLVFAIEELRADLQLTIQEVMLSKGITRSALAKRLGCSPANVTQLLAEDGNPTIETVARVFHALGDGCQMRSVYLEEQGARSSQHHVADVHASVSWEVEEPSEATSRGKKRESQSTSEIVFQVARNVTRRQAWGPAQNRNIMSEHRQAA
jgi:transcriptional regulator with XRE-family HTH domain